MPDLDEFAMAKLAREMAMAVRNYKVVFADFGITEEDYYQIEKNEFYARAKAQFALEWNSSLSATERVRVISAAYLEQALPVLGAKATDPSENLGAATEVAKFLARNAGIGNEKGDPRTAAERFVITINLGADIEGKPVIEKFDKSVAIDANDVGPYGTAQTLEQTTAQTPAKGAQTAQLALPLPEDTGPIDFFSGLDP